MIVPTSSRPVAGCDASVLKVAVLLLIVTLTVVSFELFLSVSSIVMVSSMVVPFATPTVVTVPETAILVAPG